MKNFIEGPWLYRILALFLSLLLFSYVNVDKINTTRQINNNNTQMLATRSETVKVPLQINADTDKYFITGYPQKVKVTLSGPNALITSAVNTLNFRVIGDLTKLGAGTHTVKLTQTGINKDIKVKIEPATIKVKIEHKLTKEFPVQVNVKEENLETGYSIGNPKISQDVVQVSGAKAAVNSVARVVATIDPDKGTKNDINEETLLQAVDRNGKTVNVLISPQTVNIKIAVQMNKKTVPLSLQKTGERSGYEYTLSSETEQVTVYGKKQTLATLTDLPVTIDMADITKNTTRTVTLTLPSGVYDSHPKQVKVNIKVTAPTGMTTSRTETTTQSSSESTTSMSQSQVQSSSSSTISESQTTDNNQSSESSSSSDSSSSTVNTNES
ncbi:CdaR family protein [Latilactobacillus sakei]|uniref:CdaR family protein n=1 Tax=Latilactobacillus sakei TaxID=1599 RepID=UPI00117317C8|nr:CdaR family protein [Latilactobacillus sakei]VTU49437.1 hypothetical protein AMBR_KLALICIF_00277 [Latilactobacillus sakei]